MKSDRLKCVFVHIPKTGGFSLEKAIWDENEFIPENFWMGFINRYHNPFQTGGLQHLTALRMRQLMGRELFQSYFKFTITRNPYDRIVSQYKYMQKRRDLRRLISMKRKDSFARYLHLIQKRAHIQWEPQVSFLYDYSGRLLVDEIIRFENMGVDAKRILDKLGVTRDLPHINASKDKSPYQSFYDQECRDIVAELYHDDFETLGYSRDL